MAITSPIAGAYTSTWAGDPLAYTRQGYRISFMQKVERIEESDLFGLTLIDLVYRGAAVTIDAIFRVYSANVIGALWPWADTFGNIWTAARPIAQLASTEAADALVLTAVANTSAANSPATFTADLAVISEQSLDVVFNSTARDVPLRFDVLADDTAGTGSLFAVS